MIQFHTIKERIEKDRIAFGFEEFYQTLIKNKPSLLFHSEWSETKPLYTILEYNGDGLLYFCNNWADKTPHQKTIKEFYDSQKYEGIQYLFINQEVPA